MYKTSGIDAMLGELEPSGIPGHFEACKMVAVAGIEFDPDEELATVELGIYSYHNKAHKQTFWVRITHARAASLLCEQFCFLKIDELGASGKKNLTVELFGDGTVFVALLTEKPV